MLVCAQSATAPPPAAPVNIIFDTDIYSDIDDAMALAMLHALQDRKEINLLAVTVSTEDPWCVSYVNLINTFYGHPDIPVGVVHGGVSEASLRKQFPQMTWPVTQYTEHLSTQKNSRSNTFTYPHKPVDRLENVPDAVAVLRKALAAAPDGSVVIVQVGYSTNLSRLLDSTGDAASPLSGSALIAKKVRLLSVMAGNFGPATLEDGKQIPKGSREFNILVDVPAAKHVFAAWPTAIVASGFEIGISMSYPRDSIEHDFSYVADHPIAETYQFYCEEQKALRKWSCPHQHATFDLTSVLYAVRPSRGYFTLSKPGTITILDDGSSRFTESEDGKAHYLILSDEQKPKTLEAMVMLTSQPPEERPANTERVAAESKIDGASRKEQTLN